MRVLVVNAGSSSLKLHVLDGADAVLAGEQLDAQEGRVDEDAVRAALGRLPDADAVGHRVVHGGPDFTGPVRLGADVRARIDALRALAPLHQGPALAAMVAVDAALPGVPAVACFDTAFHTTIPASAATYALPADWRARWPLRRYGFHGLSHGYVARRFPDARVVSCHLGSGASVCAIDHGASVDTTMGFTPLEGLIMATRSGTVDPGLVLWLITDAGLDAADVTRRLGHDSGLKGLAGSGDVRVLLARDDADARLALDAYVHRLRGAIAAMAAAMNGLDLLVFTAGVGEHTPAIRSRVSAGLAFLGVALDAAANEAAHGDAPIAARDARVGTYVLAAREDLAIAGQVRAVLGADG